MSIPAVFVCRSTPQPPAGDPLAQLDIQQAIQDHFGRIHRAALILCGNAWDADDMAQETFLVAAREYARFEGRSQPYTWLYGILLNLIRRQRRRRTLHRDKLRILWDSGRQDAQTVPEAEAPLEATEWKRSMWGVVAELPEPQRHALVLRYSEHLSYNEIAEVLQCPLGTVKSRIFHALTALRKKLSIEGAEDTRQAPQHPAEDVSHVV